MWQAGDGATRALRPRAGARGPRVPDAYCVPDAGAGGGGVDEVNVPGGGCGAAGVQEIGGGRIR